MLFIAHFVFCFFGQFLFYFVLILQIVIAFLSGTELSPQWPKQSHDWQHKEPKLKDYLAIHFRQSTVEICLQASVWT